MLRKVSTAAGTNVVIVLVSLSVIHAAAPQDSRVQDPPHSSVHHGLAACSASHHAVCGMHSTVNHKMHTPCCYRSLDVATPWLWSDGMRATVDRSKMIKKCIQFQLSMFVPMPSLLSLLFESSSLLPRPCLIIIEQINEGEGK